MIYITLGYKYRFHLKQHTRTHTRTRAHTHTHTYTHTRVRALDSGLIASSTWFCIFWSVSLWFENNASNKTPLGHIYPSKLILFLISNLILDYQVETYYYDWVGNLAIHHFLATADLGQIFYVPLNFLAD